jgi:hypothetical protein
MEAIQWIGTIAWVEPYVDRTARMKRRLMGKYRKATVYMFEILTFEELYHAYTLCPYSDDGIAFAGKLKKVLVSKAKFWSSQCIEQGLRIYPDDMESEFYHRIWKLITPNKNDYSDYYLLERIQWDVRNAAIDLIRREKANRRLASSRAVNLDGYLGGTKADQTVNVEGDVTNRLLIRQMTIELELDDQERRLLHYLCNEPEASLQEIATHLGLKHRSEASRIKDRLKRKLSLYKQSAFA